MTDLILAFVTWRISHLLVEEDAPFSLAARFRHAVGIRYDVNSNRIAESEWAKLFDCVYCFSIWAGWAIALLHYRNRSFVARGLAYSAVSVIVERVVNK